MDSLSRGVWMNVLSRVVEWMGALSRSGWMDTVSTSGGMNALSRGD